MSTLLDELPVTQTSMTSQRLRTAMAAVRVSVSWFGVRKTLSQEQRSQAADTFGANAKYVSAGKKLLDTGHTSFRTVTAVKNRSLQFWKGMTLPYPECAIRLLRQDQVELFDDRMRQFQEELAVAVEQLGRRFEELKAAAERRLGDLFNQADYPTSLEGLFRIDFDFPSVEPPDYLRQLNPELYRAECDRVAARFDEAVQLAEDAFTTELSTLVKHLSERLSGNADGKPKVFRDSAISNLLDFFNRFQNLNVRSNEQLDDLVENARQIVQGRDPQQLRDNRLLRQTVAQELSEVQDSLDELLVDRPRRNIIRRPR